MLVIDMIRIISNHLTSFQFGLSTKSNANDTNTTKTNTTFNTSNAHTQLIINNVPFVSVCDVAIILL